MDEIARETAEVIAKDFRLDFIVPTAEELDQLRHIHRELTVGEEARIRRAADGLAVFLEAVEKGDVEFEDLPPAIRTRLTLFDMKRDRDYE